MQAGGRQIASPARRRHMEAKMKKLVHAGLLCAAGVAVFSAGWAFGQQAAPTGDVLVDQRLLATIDLAKAVEGMPARELRLSHVRVAPRGHIGLHGHGDDPTVVYLVSGR